MKFVDSELSADQKVPSAIVLALKFELNDSIQKSH
jgi:hypothetical protein